MKRVTKLLVILGCISFTTISVAMDVSPIQGKNAFSFGFDIKEIFERPVGQFRQIMVPNKAASTIYLAYRTQKMFGYEMGYTWTDRRPKDFDVAIGTTAFGATSAVPQKHTVKIRLKETYFDFFAHMRMSRCVEAKLGLGVGYVRQGIKVITQFANSDPLTTALHNLKGRTAITGRFLVGAQWFVSERIGLRGLFSYENLSQIKIAGTANKTNRQLMTNAYTVSLGIFWTFYGREEFEPL